MLPNTKSDTPEVLLHESGSPAQSLMILESIKIFQNFQRSNLAWSKKYKLLQSSSTQTCWALQVKGHRSKVNKVVKVPPVPNMALWLAKVGWDRDSKSHWCLHLWKVRRLSLHRTDTKLKHVEKYCRSWWKVKLDLAMRTVELPWWKFPHLTIPKSMIHLVKVWPRNCKPYHKVRKLIRQKLTRTWLKFWQQNGESLTFLSPLHQLAIQLWLKKLWTAPTAIVWKSQTKHDWQSACSCFAGTFKLETCVQSK